MDIAHDGAADEDVLHRHEVRVLLRVDDADVGQFAVEELIDGVQRSAHTQAVLELDGHFLSFESLEEGEEQHRGRSTAGG